MPLSFLEKKKKGRVEVSDHNDQTTAKAIHTPKTDRFQIQARMETRLQARLKAKKAELDGYRPLAPGLVKALYQDLKVVLTYHSNAIEGNSLSLNETKLVIEYGLTAASHPLKDYLEATNHAQAFERLVELVERERPFELKLEQILELHRLVMSGIHDHAGELRTRPVYIRGASVNPPPASKVAGMLEQWLAWLSGPGLAYDPVVRAAIAHHDFEFIHPFEDGNGRTGRLLLNLMLLREGYPPALLLREWRASYISALDLATVRGNFNPIINLVGRAVEGGLDLYLEAIRVPSKEKEKEGEQPEEEGETGSDYQPLAQLAAQSGLSVEYLGWLIRQGRLEAVKRRGRWYSTSAALAHYQAEVKSGAIPKGRPPKAEVAPPTER